jgi:hypothetical protein
MTARSAVPGKRPFRMIAGVSTLSDLADGQGAGWGYPGSGYTGVQYFVNNISGSSGASGLSWDDPFDEVSTAVTASEAQRQLPTLTTNEYVRNQIFVQGTGTAYTAITAFPNYCDIIGVGAVPYGDGAGIPVISGKGAATTGTGAKDAAAGSARGLRLFGLQFESSADFYCLDFVNLFRSEIAFCAFKASDPTLVTVVTTGGIRFTGSSGGNYIHDNMWIGGNDSWFTYGIKTDSGTVIFNFNRIENNMIEAETAGISIAAQTVTGDGTSVNNNKFTGGNHVMATAVDDNATTGRIFYSGNMCGSTDGGQLVNNGAIRWVANYRANALSTVTAS